MVPLGHEAWIVKLIEMGSDPSDIRCGKLGGRQLLVCWATVRVVGAWVSLLVFAACVDFVLVLLCGFRVSLDSIEPFVF